MNACPDKPRDRVAHVAVAVALCTIVALGGVGCTSPPSVMPLLNATQQTLEREAERLTVDTDRDAEWIEQARLSLEHAYEADLHDVDALTPEWVGSATQVYVSAREALVRHESTLREERHRRAENLQAAAEATRRAAAMLQQQDRLWLDAVGGDGWSLLDSFSNRR